MNILITAGGTSEKIDEVRRITNTATGKLGSLIAEEFCKKTNNDTEITYIHGCGSYLPKIDCADLIRINSAYDLKKAVENILFNKKIDAVVHTMAVSDYSVKSVAPSFELSAAIAESVADYNANNTERSHLECAVNDVIVKFQNNSCDKKISSDFNNLIIIAEKTPKIISLFKKLQPETFLVGFKLLAGADTKTLLEAGYNLLLKNNCNLVFANDISKVNTDNHSGILIDPERSHSEISGKRAIASCIAENIINKLKKHS